MGTRLLAVVAEGTRNRSYVTPTERMEAVARNAKPEWKPDVELPNDPRAIWTPSYGLTHFYHLFTHRQLVALTAFSDLVSEARIKVVEDANAALRHRGGQSLHEGGRGAVAYADSIAVGLSFAISKLADRGSTICTWFTERDSTRNTFARQGIPMTWDYAELNPLLDGTGSFRGAVEWTAESISALGNVSCESSVAYQRDAQWQQISIDKIISTDPPYFDNIPYADLSDFFYVWLRRSLKNVFPELFATVATPKEEELVASPYHQAGKEAAKRFFLDGMTKALSNLASQAHPAFPTSIYYALKQSDTGDKGTASTGWEVFLTAVMKAGLTWISTTPNRLSSGRV
jgi:putative DNA methylase